MCSLSSSAPGSSSGSRRIRSAPALKRPTCGCCIGLLLLAFLTAGVWAANPVPDFHLVDTNPNSPRSQEQVSPRDYMLRISAFYFATAGCSHCRDQFRHLGTIARELRASRLPVAIEILGVNRADQSMYNFLIPSQGDLPWLQDTNAQSVWFNWGAQLRELWVLDARNQVITITNLTAPNLALELHRNALKEVLISYAQLIDTDADGLPDDWELHYFKTLSHGADADPDADGADNRAEYAFGTLPNDPARTPSMRISAATKDNPSAFRVTFRRPAGATLDYFAAFSNDLRKWSEDPTLTEGLSLMRQCYDGSGTAEITLPLAFPLAQGAAGFLKVEALPARR